MPGRNRSFARAAALATAVAACAPPVPVSNAVGTACSDGRPMWSISGTELRTLGVALAIPDGGRSGWRVYGDQRLRDATTGWNALALPLRLRVVPDLASADIRVTILDVLPADHDAPEGLRRYRAGVTRLDQNADGQLRRAHIGVAERSPLGAPYSVDEQLATLVHELGHAMGLPHADERFALMSVQPMVTSLTPADARLATRVLRAPACEGPSVATRG
jgi:hypothetical protein